MRKIDYVHLASAIAHEMHFGQRLEKQGEIERGRAVQESARRIALRFAENASVDREQFLKACRVE